jgi:predicted ATPase/class 3 adenylate cyclase
MDVAGAPPALNSSAGVTLPTGTVTFLFSDIEGSTQRWETHRKAMDAAMKRHDARLRAATESHGGYVFKTVGDAFCVVFARASDAVAACAEVQRALSTEDFSAVEGLRVRCALHTGEAVERNGDYFGPAVNRVARLMSIGHGGQVLVSGVTRDLAHGDLPSGITFMDQGLQRLRDLTEPEHVWQLSIEGLPTDFPPLRSLDALPNNLPIAPTIFVGREHDVSEVKTLLGRHRLLTLVGSGGVGKTRLALQVAAEVLDRYPDGVWFADLAPITDSVLVSSVIAQAVGMSQQEGHRVDEAIPQWLKRKNLLLILDNCEHVLETVASLASSIFRTAPDVRMLSASRQALDIGGEVTHRLPSLSVPTNTADLKMDEALRYDAIGLFVDRAHAADTRFTLTDDTAPIVAEICRRLDGIPLAIELAAARVKILSIPNLAQRLNERFKILTGGSRSALPRQKTLSALIDWSYDLLTPQEQGLFVRLGIFAGGFSLDAAAVVCGIEDLNEIEVLDLIGSLADKSLVVADTSGEHERYRLLESTAAYALEKLSASGQQEIFTRLHAEYFRDRANRADEGFGSGSTFEWLAQQELELDNYRTALEWALTDSHDAVLGGAIAGALGELWANAGLAVEGRYWMGLALARIHEGQEPRIAARLRLALSNLSSGNRKYDEAEKAIQLYGSVGDARYTGRARYQLAFALFQMGRSDEAREANTLAVATARECADNVSMAACLNQQAGIEWVRGDVAAAREIYPRALSAFKKLGNESGMAMVLLNMAELEFATGHPEQALRFVRDALELESRGKNASFIALSHNNSAIYRIALGDIAGARESAREGLRVARRAQAELELLVGLQHLALLAALAGNARRGGQLLGYVDGQYDRLRQKREPTEQWGYEKLTAALHEKLSKDEITTLASEGATWSEDQAVEEALTNAVTSARDRRSALR